MPPFGGQVWVCKFGFRFGRVGNRFRRLLHPPPFLYMSALFKTDAPFWWPGLGRRFWFSSRQGFANGFGGPCTHPPFSTCRFCSKPMPLFVDQAWVADFGSRADRSSNRSRRLVHPTPLLSRRVLLKNNVCLWVFGQGPHRVDLNMLGAKDFRIIAPLLLPLLMAPTPTPPWGCN